MNWWYVNNPAPTYTLNGWSLYCTVSGISPLFLIPGSASLVVWNAAERLTAKIWFHLSVGKLSTGPTCCIPAGGLVIKFTSSSVCGYLHCWLGYLGCEYTCLQWNDTCPESGQGHRGRRHGDETFSVTNLRIEVGLRHWLWSTKLVKPAAASRHVWIADWITSEVPNPCRMTSYPLPANTCCALCTFTVSSAAKCTCTCK